MNLGVKPAAPGLEAKASGRLAMPQLSLSSWTSSWLSSFSLLFYPSLASLMLLLFLLKCFVLLVECGSETTSSNIAEVSRCDEQVGIALDLRNQQLVQVSREYLFALNAAAVNSSGSSCKSAQLNRSFHKFQLTEAISEARKAKAEIENKNPKEKASRVVVTREARSLRLWSQLRQKQWLRKRKKRRRRECLLSYCKLLARLARRKSVLSAQLSRSFARPNCSEVSNNLRLAHDIRPIAATRQPRLTARLSSSSEKSFVQRKTTLKRKLKQEEARKHWQSIEQFEFVRKRGDAKVGADSRQPEAHLRVRRRAVLSHTQSHQQAVQNQEVQYLKVQQQAAVAAVVEAEQQQQELQQRQLEEQQLATSGAQTFDARNSGELSYAQFVDLKELLYRFFAHKQSKEEAMAAEVVKATQMPTLSHSTLAAEGNVRFPFQTTTTTNTTNNNNNTHTDSGPSLRANDTLATLIEIIKSKYKADNQSLTEWFRTEQQKFASLRNKKIELLSEQPTKAINVCADGPKILVYPNVTGFMYCPSPDQWLAKLWADLNIMAPIHYPIITLTVLIFLFGTIGNFFVCLSVYRNHQLRSVTNYFIVNLAFADFLVILICLPATVIWDLSLTWFFGTIACKSVMFLQDVSVSVSVLTLTAISLDRFYAICYPLKFNSSLRKAKNIIFVLWIASMLIMIPDLIYLSAHSSKELTEAGLDTVLYSDCNYNLTPEKSRYFQFVKTVLLYFLPFILMFVAHFKILKTLKSADKALATSQESLTVKRECTCSCQKSNDDTRNCISDENAHALSVPLNEERVSFNTDARPKQPTMAAINKRQTLNVTCRLAESTKLNDNKLDTGVDEYSDEASIQQCKSINTLPTKMQLDVTNNEVDEVRLEVEADTLVTQMKVRKTTNSHSDRSWGTGFLFNKFKQNRKKQKAINNANSTFSPTNGKQQNALKFNSFCDKCSKTTRNRPVISHDGNIELAASASSTQKPYSGQTTSSIKSNVMNASSAARIESRRKAAKMLMCITCLFGICYLPVHLINFLRLFLDDIPQNEVTSTISMLSHCFCYLNSAMNPIIYNYMNTIFRAEFKKFFFCFKSDTNQTKLRKQSNQLTNVARKRSRPNLLAV